MLHYVEVVEENALLRNKNRQHLATLKGVSPSFEEVGALDTMIVRGTMRLQRGRANYAVMGYGVAYYLDVDINTLENAVSVYVPSSETSSVMLHQAFESEKISPAGIFSIQQELDTKYVFVPCALPGIYQDIMMMNSLQWSCIWSVGLMQGRLFRRLKLSAGKSIPSGIVISRKRCCIR
ncbi:MAG: hypothetical protein U5L09_19150 [Bacteroidales bacterium]|nr:hypothetical protein [Bacteroidales bacterium]